jgi:predicted secreted Zn-dependent protease
MTSEDPTNGDSRELAPGVMAWRKASRSGTGNCVQVAAAGRGMIAVRDSKNPEGGLLIYTPSEWAAFIDGVKNGEFDDLLG